MVLYFAEEKSKTCFPESPWPRKQGVSYFRPAEAGEGAVGWKIKFNR
jgi:hypothetical protein